MSATDEIEFNNLEELNRVLGKTKRGASRRRNQQRGGDYGSGTPLPWSNFNPQTGLNTQGLDANNYGRLSAQGVGSPTAGYGYQSGGAFDSLWGSNQPTLNQLSEPNYNTVYRGTGGEMSGGGCGCKSQKGGNVSSGHFSRDEVAIAVADVTGDPLDSVYQTINTLYGKKKRRFTEEQLDTVTMVHVEDDQDGGDATPMPWEWYNPNLSMKTQQVNPDYPMPQLMMEMSGPSGNSPYLVGGGDSHAVTRIEQFRADGKPLKDLGDGILVITPDNLAALFCYMYHLHHELKNHKNTSHLYEDAEKADVFIWSEYQDAPLDEVIPYIDVEATKFYESQNHSKADVARVHDILEVHN